MPVEPVAVLDDLLLLTRQLFEPVAKRPPGGDFRIFRLGIVGVLIGHRIEHDAVGTAVQRLVGRRRRLV